MKTIYTIFCTLATVAFFALAAYSYQQREPEPRTLAELIDKVNAEENNRKIVMLYGGAYER